VRTDASEIGVGGVLLQINDKQEEQIIALISKKFSEQAQKWSTIEQEAYGIYYTVKRLSYYLMGKEFVVETDHNNLLWMESSEVHKIIRWRIFLQSFVFLIRHIKGKENVLPDTLSRLFMIYDTFNPFEEDSQVFDPELCNIFDEPVGKYEIENSKVENEVDNCKQLMMTQEDMLNEVHGYKEGHWGAKYTWKLLCKLFPGHGISYRRVEEFVGDCDNCQKNRHEFSTKLRPIIRHLKPPHSRSAIGTDAVAITPHGKNGQTHIYMIVNLFSKLTMLYPVTGCTAKNMASAIWCYWCTYGHTDMIISDLGPDLTSELFAELIKLMGMRHKFSITDKHANGSERVARETGRHLRAIVYDTRVTDVFDDPNVIPSVQYILNQHESSETGYSPFELTFGSADIIYNNLLSQPLKDVPNVLLARLNDSLKAIKAASTDFQKALVQERGHENLKVPQNLFQPGDFVKFDKGPKPHPKMSSRFKGPFEVVHQHKNDVTTKNLVTGEVRMYSVEDLQLFAGALDQARNAAMRDQEQFVVEKVLSYTGNSNKRTEMGFKVKFADGDIVELPWSHDLLCDAYYDFCESIPHLKHLSLDTKMAKVFISHARRLDISSVDVGDVVYVDLRYFGDLWFESIELPDIENSTYVVQFKYTHWFHRSSKKKISALYLLGGTSYVMDNYAVYCWGSVKEFDKSKMTLVDQSYLKMYPKLV
jgi:hypothetical protein